MTLNTPSSNLSRWCLLCLVSFLTIHTGCCSASSSNNETSSSSSNGTELPASSTAKKEDELWQFVYRSIELTNEAYKETNADPSSLSNNMVQPFDVDASYVYDDGDDTGIVVLNEEEEQIYAVFRGMANLFGLFRNDLAQLFDNVPQEVLPDSNCYVHGGNKQGLDTLLEVLDEGNLTMIERVAAMKEDCHKCDVIVAGHGSGAGNALPFMAYLERYYDISKPYGFVFGPVASIYDDGINIFKDDCDDLIDTRNLYNVILSAGPFVDPVPFLGLGLANYTLAGTNMILSNRNDAVAVTDDETQIEQLEKYASFVNILFMHENYVYRDKISVMYNSSLSSADVISMDGFQDGSACPGGFQSQVDWLCESGNCGEWGFCINW